MQSLYACITDFENYPAFLPEVVSARIAKGAGTDVVKVQFELEVIKRFNYVLEFKLVKPNQVSWKLIESNFFKDNRGVWKLTEVGGGVQVHYELEVGFGFLVPGWVTRKLTEVSLPAMFDRFEKRAMEMKPRG